MSSERDRKAKRLLCGIIRIVLGLAFVILLSKAVFSRRIAKLS